MSRYNVTKEMEEYVSDFGKSYSHIGVKIQAEAPLIDSIYQVRALAACGGNKIFSPRYIKATFSDGRVLQYPIANESDVIAVANQLIGAGAVCLDYYGEEWNMLVGSAVGGDLNYKSTPYSDLVSSKSFAVGTFDYTSEVGLTGLTTLQLAYRIPNNDNEVLAGCQAAGLSNANSGAGVCVAKSLLSARRLIIKSTALDKDGHKGKVIRNALVSSASAIATTAISIAECAQCLGYQGEIILGLQSLI